jgi:hypothetical protein
MKTEKEILAIAEEQKQRAVAILNRFFLNTPLENSVATDLVDAIVSAAMLEISAAQAAALESSGRQKSEESNERQSKY